MKKYIENKKKYLLNIEHLINMILILIFILMRVLNDLELKANEEKKESYNEHIAAYLNKQ